MQTQMQEQRIYEDLVEARDNESARLLPASQEEINKLVDEYMIPELRKLLKQPAQAFISDKRNYRELVESFNLAEE